MVITSPRITGFSKSTFTAYAGIVATRFVGWLNEWLMISVFQLQQMVKLGSEQLTKLKDSAGEITPSAKNSKKLK